MKIQQLFNIILSLFFVLTTIGFAKAQELELYNIFLNQEDGNRIGAFISVSDNHVLSEHPDSLAIPNIENQEMSSVQTIELEKEYRKRFFTQTGISESDMVFIYDFESDVEISFKVKDLRVVASLSVYASDDDWPYSQEDYQFGFGINRILLKGISSDFYYNALVFIGKQSPFVRGGMVPVVWHELSRKEFKKMDIETSVDSLFYEYGYPKYSLGSVYSCDQGDFREFVQDVQDTKNELNLIGRHLVVVNVKTAEVVCEKIYVVGESGTLAPLNLIENKEGSYFQWTGKLFRNKPPVVFGFEYQSFGCPAISFLDKSEPDIYINCDNRH